MDDLQQESVDQHEQNGVLPAVKTEESMEGESLAALAPTGDTNIYDDYEETKPSTSALADDDLSSGYMAIFAKFQTADEPAKAEGADIE